MNSLNYLSRQFDVLASAPPTTPPSTPDEKHVALPPPPGLPRNKSYARPRLPSTFRKESTFARQGGGPPITRNEAQSEEASSKQRSFSSPSLFAARRMSILGVLSDPKATTHPPTPSSSSSSGNPEKQLTMSSNAPQLPGPPPLRRRKSHLKRKTSLRQLQRATKDEAGQVEQRWILIRALIMLWNAISALARAVGLADPEPQHVQPLLTRQMDKDDTGTSDEDDPIVARVRPKKHQQRTPDESLLLLVNTQHIVGTSPPPIFAEDITPPPLLFSLDPPSVEEVKRQTETPVPLPPSSSSTSSTLLSSQLLPNPLSASILTSRSRSSTPRPPPTPPLRKTPFHLPKTLVLDLDETLIHSTSRPMSSFSGAGTGLLGLGFSKGGRGHQVEVVLGGRSTLYHVYKRPFVDYFLRKVSTWYTLVIFTASMQEYADPVIDWLDAGRGILGRRLFRESCTQLPNGSYAKDLSIIERDLSRICLVDNSPISYGINPANGIPIEGWISDPSDEALLDLLPVLDSLRFTGDVRRILGIRGFIVQKEGSG